MDDNGVFLDEESFALERNESIRASMIAKITDDKDYIKDTDRAKLLLSVLDSSDKSAFGKSKARSNSKQADSSANVANSVRAFMAMAAPSVPIPSTARRTRSVSAPLTDAVPGEKDIGQFPLTLDDLRTS